ncbi:DUF1565 domain-containing protein [Massilia sp. PAMC28688]|uniref:choice-of-anchor Q domain-containing protein n=1 Tax=Massilia sp. PAMC28688 TaxID=2861283 RepID=UPI001C62D578|nr:choice-of-anchor Q domain-containing protein [Massilia sp. PAMC28688]QYF93528.1 DUF1565 domain-containing protein [Massilia sp. PAMC28688]
MNKSLRFNADRRVNALVSSSIAVLLAALATSAPAQTTQQLVQGAAVTYNGTVAPADIYVSPTGSDTAAGTQAAPFRTIARASRAATAGVTVRVLPGTYPGGFQTTASGTAEAPIRYVSTTPRGAKIVPPANSVSNSAWDNRGSYVQIEGFEVNGSATQSGTKWLMGLYTAGSFATIKNNYVHHIAKTVACAGSGGGIGADSYYKGRANIISSNVVHDVGPTGCATFLGVFVNTASTRVDNNLIYNISNAGIRLWHDATHNVIVNNTVFNTHTALVVGGDGGYISTAPNDYTRVSNNLFYDSARHGIHEIGSTGRNNKYANNLVYRSGSVGVVLNNGLVATGTVAAEPGFVNYVKTGGGDYHPSATSPAVKKGLELDAPTVDIEGTARNTTVGIDLGAYQRAGTTTPTPPPPPPPPPPSDDPAPPPPPATAWPPVIPATTYNYWVSPTGSDSNPGTQAAPFRSIAKAAGLAKPSTTVRVLPGTYAGGFRTNTSGSSTGRIYYVATTKWGVKIVPPASSSNDTAWDNRGSYVSIIGFHIDGTNTQSGTKWTHGIYNGGSYGMIQANWVHHIAKTSACTSAGGSAIGVDSYYRGIKSDVVGNLVHDIGPVGCRFVQGIYVSTSGTVKNNVVYRVAEGAIHLWHDATNVIITNNTVTASNTGIIVGGGDYYHTRGPNNNTIVANNIVYDNKMGISEQGQTGTGNRYTNNLVYQNSTYNFQLKNGLTHSGTIGAAPGFKSYTRTGTPDLHITTTSPAIGKGTATNAPATDFDGRPRNATTGYDIGAYQH